MSTATLMARVADRLAAELDAVEAEMVAEITRAQPALGADAVLLAEVSASSRANISRFITVARNADDPPPPDAPLEALDVARAFVRRGIDSTAMHQAYRRGQQVLWRRWMAAAQSTVPGDRLADVLTPSLELLFTYVDDVLGRVIDAMQHEREQALGGALARRAETIRLLLDGAPLDVGVASRRLGYDLRGRHTALVLWSEADEPSPAALEAAAAALARAAGAQRPLTLVAGTGALWLWLPGGGPVAAPDGDPAVRVAVGPVRTGPAGFRASHEAALSIQRLMAGNPEGGRLATYDELEVTALAGQDRRRALEFVEATLGPLAADTASAARLRETLRVFLEEAEHAPRAAARLHTHRNTVLQRVRRATDLLGFAPRERRLALELALELRRRLGR